MRATTKHGSLQVIPNCFIEAPGGNKIDLTVFPDISDSKSANYSAEDIPGRASPIMTYNYSSPRNITTDLTFVVTQQSDIERNLRYLYLIESLVYPQDAPGVTNAPFAPPAIVHLVCGDLLGIGGICVCLRTYSVRFSPDVPIDPETMLPYKFTINCQWEVVYSCKNLPCNKRIITYGN